MSDPLSDPSQDPTDALGAAQPGGFDLGGILEQAQALQQQMSAAQQARAAQVVTGSAGGGKVRIEASGSGEFRHVSIAPEVVDPGDVEMLEDLVLAALRDAMDQIDQGLEQSMGGIQLPDLGGLGLGLGGLEGPGGDE